MEEVISTWSNDFKPTQKEIEGIPVLARGKAVHQPMAIGDDGARKPSTTLTPRNGFANRRPPSSQGPSSHSVSPHPEKRVMRIPSSNPIPTFAPPAPEPSPSPEPAPVYSPPDYSTHLTPVSSYSAHSPAGPSMDYFQRSSTTNSTIQKKKPPPPPPKRVGSQNFGTFAVAQYDFQGQSDGDLSFKEGDQIKVIKKTDSTDDWWDGELRGVKGSFPANYCKLT